MLRIALFSVISLALLLQGCSDPASVTDAMVDACSACTADASGLDAGRDASPLDAGDLDGARDASMPDAGPPVGEWTIPMGQRVGQKLALYPLYPRPDAETSPDAYHRRAHTQIRYRVVIGVQGGEWPFRYELVDAPAGAAFLQSELVRSTDAATGGVLHVTVHGGHGGRESRIISQRYNFRIDSGSRS